MKSTAIFFGLWLIACSVHTHKLSDEQTTLTIIIFLVCVATDIMKLIKTLSK